MARSGLCRYLILLSLCLGESSAISAELLSHAYQNTAQCVEAYFDSVTLPGHDATIRLLRENFGQGNDLFSFENILDSFDLDPESNALIPFEVRGPIPGSSIRHYGIAVEPEVHAVYFQNEKPGNEGSEFQLFLRVLHRGAARNLGGRRVAVALTLQTANFPSRNYWLVDGSILLNSGDPLWSPPLRNLPQDFIDFVLSSYRRRLKLRNPETGRKEPISEEFLSKLRAISQEAFDRTLFFAKTREGAVVLDKNGMPRNGLNPQPGYQNAPPGFSFPEGGHFEIEGAAAIVLSSGPFEPLPLEILGRFRLPRNTKPGMKVAEIGRYVVSRTEIAETSLQMIRQFATALAGRGDVETIFIEADEPHRTLFSRFGFQVVREQVNAGGGKDYVLSVHISDFLTHTILPDDGGAGIDKALH